MHGSMKSVHSANAECAARARKAAGLPRHGMSLATGGTCMYICGGLTYRGSLVKMSVAYIGNPIEGILYIGNLLY